MSYNAIVAKIDKVWKHPNADKIQLAHVLGSQIVVGLDSKEGDIGIFLPEDGQLSIEYANANKLIGYMDETTGEKKGGYFSHRRRVKCQKFRGEKSEGYFAPLSSLEFTGYDISKLKIGDRFDKLNTMPICNKYITERSIKEFNINNNGKKSKYEKSKYQYITKLFPEHFDTDQFKHNINNIETGALITITSKKHGTSGRACCVQTPIKLNIFQKVINKIFFGNREHTKYEVVHGTRRVILNNKKKDDYYKDSFREKILNKLKSVINKNYVFYYEIVGYTESGKPIMNPVDITKTKDRELIKRFSNPMIYKYGCLEGECDFYIYRVTTINPDGIQEELSWNRVKRLCKEAGIKHVPEIDSFIYDGNIESFSKYIEYLTEHKPIEDPIDNSHIREGICIRVDSPDGRTKIYKNKLFLFRLLESIVKDSGAIDTEEAEDMKKEVTN